MIGEIPEENPKGYFIKPTIFVDCTPDMVIVKGMFNNKNTHLNDIYSFIIDSNILIYKRGNIRASCGDPKILVLVFTCTCCEQLAVRTGSRHILG